MVGNDLCDLTIAELGEKIASKEVSPIEVVEAHLACIEALNPMLNAFITVAHDRARAEAKQATEEVVAGNIRSPLHGIPIGVKDIIDSPGVRTTQGSRFLSNYFPSE